MIWLFLVAGLWAALSYTTPPIRLAYRPFLGEWAGPWPVMVACTVGAYYIFTRHLKWEVLMVGAIHATLCIAWLMQHHLPEIQSDLEARPRKLTSVALFALTFGLRSPRFLVSGYFLLLAALLGFFASRLFNSILITSFRSSLDS